MAVPTCSVAELATVNEAVILDVREPDEYAAGHVPGARNVPLGQIADRAAEFSGAHVFVICQKGRRSEAATSALRSASVDAVNVAGGTSAWVAEGRETER